MRAPGGHALHQPLQLVAGAGEGIEWLQRILAQLALELQAQRLARVGGVGAPGGALKRRRARKRRARRRDLAALEGGAEDEAAGERHVEAGGLHVRASAGGRNERAIAELIL